MKYFYLLFLSLYTVFTNAQIIRGTVVNAQNGKPIKEAAVFFDNTTSGTETDSNGQFEIKLLSNNKSVLIVSAVGYEYSIISNPVENTALNIRLREEFNVLDEIVIDKNVFSRKEYLKAFKYFFIGNTANAKRTKIENEADVSFYYDTKTNTFSAHTDKPIVVNNQSLGYKIYFHLQNFQVQFNTKTLNPDNYTNSSYLGYSQFKELNSSNKTKKNRNETYNKSSSAFFRDLINGNLNSATFLLAVDGLKVNPENYFKVSKYADYADVCVIQSPVQKKPAVTSKTIVNGVFKPELVTDYIEVEIPFTVLNMQTKEQSLFFLKESCLQLSNKGVLVNPNDVLFGGFFGDLKIADMLPFDFATAEIKKENK